MRLTQAAAATTRSAFVADLRRMHRRGRLSVAIAPDPGDRRSRAYLIDARAVAELMLATPQLLSP